MDLTIEGLRIVQMHLFGDVKFLDLLVTLMIVDIGTGVAKAIKEGKLLSRTAWYGFARKIGAFAMIVVANVIDVILSLNGVLAFSSVLFYIANEGLSIVENLSQMGVPVPKAIQDRLHVIQVENDNVKGEDK